MNRSTLGLKLSKAIPGFLQHKPAEALSPCWLRTDYEPRRLGGKTEPLAPKTLRNIWVSLSAFFTWATTEFQLPNHMKGVTAPKFENAPVEPFSKEEIGRLLKACEYCREANTA